VCYDDLEMLRNWRNSNFVNKRMVSNEYITKEMQEKWFDKINNDSNYYFIAEYKNEKVGVINVSHIDKNSGEGAIYLASDKFEDSSIVARMVLCFNDFVFDELKLDFIFSFVKKDNKKAITSTIAQGGVVNNEKTTADYVHFTIAKDNYKNKTKKIRIILNKLP
jgi:UDP-4-amino-4,6-dideoxy-N-acetyl-beta-L-altrosamine N-acetyltransferase